MTGYVFGLIKQDWEPKIGFLHLKFGIRQEWQTTLENYRKEENKIPRQNIVFSVTA